MIISLDISEEKSVWLLESNKYRNWWLKIVLSLFNLSGISLCKANFSHMESNFLTMLPFSGWLNKVHWFHDCFIKSGSAVCSAVCWHWCDRIEQVIDESVNGSFFEILFLSCPCFYKWVLWENQPSKYT